MVDANPWSRFRAEAYSLLSRNPKSNLLAVDLADPAPDHVTLDVGCGTGAAVRAAAAVVRRAAGVDNSVAMLRIAERRSRGVTNVEFHVASAESLPFPEVMVDRVWTVHAFHHWSDQSVGMAEALRVLRPGGRLLVVERRNRGQHGLTVGEADMLGERLVAAGFTAAEVEQHGQELVVSGFV